MNFKCLFLSLLISSPFSLSLTPTKHYGYTYDNEYKDYSVAGKGSVSYELEEMGYNLYEFNESYQKDEELITCTQSFDSNNSLHTYVYIFTKDVTIEYVDITISTSLERDEQGNYDENPRSYPLYLVSYNIENTLRKYEIMDLSLDTFIRRLAVSKINSLKYTSEFNKEYSIINVSMCYLFKGLNNDELESYYEGLDTLIITDHEMGTFLTGYTILDNVIPAGETVLHDSWFYFFNTNIAIDSIIDLDFEYFYSNYYINGLIGLSTVPTIELIKNSLEKNNDIVLPYFPVNDPLSYTKGYLTESENITSIIKATDYVDITNSHYWFLGFLSIKKTERIKAIIDLNKYVFDSINNDIDLSDFSNKYRWAVNFNNSERIYVKPGVPVGYNYCSPTTKGSLPTGASILRIKFIKDGVVYNMNVVDTRVDASFVVDATTSLLSENKLFIIIFVIILCILLLGALASIITPIKNVVVIVIKYTWKAIVFVFKLITWPIKFLFTGDKSFW